jgi:Na+/serine symporter
MKTFTNILLRIVATFAASGLSVIGAGAIAGVPLWKACFMAGMAGVAVVVEGLSRAFLDDGKLSATEINEVFTKVDKKAKDNTSAE